MSMIFLAPSGLDATRTSRPPCSVFKRCASPQRIDGVWLVVILTGMFCLLGCQPADTSLTDDASHLSTHSDDERVIQSTDAAAHIAKLQPVYVAQMQRLQQRLHAEYVSLQAADTADPIAIEPAKTNTSTAVGERDLTILKRISLEPRRPIMLTPTQLIERYQQALAALYQPVKEPLGAEDINTLIDIATLVPQLFEQAQIAGQLNAKSPALARLIVQHQVWEQVERQQVKDMQQMKVVQQREFEALMSKFNKTIATYDDKIATYEKTLNDLSE